MLKQGGDFRSNECIKFLKQSDIVVTNPPFSLFREYVAQLIEFNKKFIIIANLNTRTYKEIFKLLKDDKIWIGNTKPKKFIVGSSILSREHILKEFGNVCWYTNLDIPKRHEILETIHKFSPEKYPKYDNYDAINVNKVSEIPLDYDGVMGVPVTFLDKYNPEQFEILALGIIGSCKFTKNIKMEILDKNGNPTGKFTFNAKGTLYLKFNPKTDKKPAFKNAENGELYSSVYARILIKKSI